MYEVSLIKKLEQIINSILKIVPRPKILDDIIYELQEVLKIMTLLEELEQKRQERENK